MLVKLLRPLLESGLNTSKLISYQNLTTSTVLFQQGKNTEKTSNLKNQQQNQQKQKQSGNKKQSRAESDVEQERSQQEGPADKAAERKSSENSDTPKKSKK